jgi:serine/threonine protein kinase
MVVGPEGGTPLPLETSHDDPDGYQNLTRIDQGGFATVYRALDTRFNRTVALKILHSDSLDERQLRRFNAECLAIGRVCSHPNIVTVYDAGITRGGRPWLAMEYCSGGTLAQKVHRQGPLPVGEVISIGARLCEALSAAHEAGILHRDVKPHNVLLTSYGEPALADFGIASVVVEGETSSIATETAAYTVVHAAPEILEGAAGTTAADIYSLASTLYTLLAGQAPFAREARVGLAPLVARILLNDLPVIAAPDVPPDLERLLRRSMAARPQDRPASASELGASLTSMGERLARSAAVPPSAQEIHQRARPTTRRGDHGESVPRHRAAAPARTPARPPIGAGRLLASLGAISGVLLAVFTASGLTHQGSEPSRTHPSPPAVSAVRAADRYAPAGLAVGATNNPGELIVTWRMPVSPDVVATVIYQGTGVTREATETARARAVVSYDGGPLDVPRATLHGLPTGQRVCLSAVHMISVNDKISNAEGRPVCAVPR